MILTELKSFLRKFDHILLLGSLLFLVASPIWTQVVGASELWSDLSSIMIVISGLSVTYSHFTTKFPIKFFLGVITIITLVLELLLQTKGWLENVAQFTQVAFFLTLTITLFGLILRSRKVDGEVVINSISGYLLLGLSWAIIISIWSNTYPGSFNYNAEDNGFYHEVYYSFVTLTTLGYGDILPLTPAGKSWSILISVTGAFYTTVVLGMIVGKFISHEALKNLNKK